MRWFFDPKTLVTVRGIPVRMLPAALIFWLWMGSILVPTLDQYVTFVGIQLPMLMFSIVAHEFGHGLMARRFGHTFEHVTLIPMGGVARVSSIGDTPYELSVIAGMGPLVSLELAFIGSVFLSFVHLGDVVAEHVFRHSLTTFTWSFLFSARPCACYSNHVMNLVSLDKKILTVFQRASLPIMRMAIALVYGWFGILKVFGMTPADQLVSALQVRTIAFIPEQTFLRALGLFEVVVAILFLIPKFTRLAILFLVLHMITTFLPLVFLPDLTWSGFLQPTLIGQYILKNIIILALAMAIGVQLKPLRSV